jgi:8-oxo-dGTP pyrophosphatase MutT (NUDIX family)
MAYKSFASGYLVKDGKVLLVHHKKFNKWTPPGGHMEENETPDQTVIREWKEELGMPVEVISDSDPVFEGTEIDKPIPVPFYMDLEKEFFDSPRIGNYFFVRQTEAIGDIALQLEEVLEAKWFNAAEIENLETFDQVRALAKYALIHYPQIKKAP